MSTLMTRVSTLVEELRGLMEALEGNAKSLDGLDSRRQELRDEIVKIKAERETARRETDALARAAQEKLAADERVAREELQGRIAESTRKEMAALSAREDRLRAATIDEAKTLNEVALRVESLKRDLAVAQRDHDSGMAALGKEEARLTQTVQGLKATIADLKSRLATVG